MPGHEWQSILSRRGREVKSAMKDILDARAKSHGQWTDVARIAQAIRTALRSSTGWAHMSPEQREALDMIASKQARIVCGDPSFTDHWVDIAGYATLNAK